MKKYSPPFVILKPLPNTWAAEQIKGHEPGIVAADYDCINYVVCYEGNLYHAANLQTWGDRASLAADRLATGYPTIARGIFDKGQFEVIGTISKPEKLNPRLPTFGRVWQIERTDS